MPRPPRKPPPGLTMYSISSLKSLSVVFGNDGIWPLPSATVARIVLRGRRMATFTRDGTDLDPVRSSPWQAAQFVTYSACPGEVGAGAEPGRPPRPQPNDGPEPPLMGVSLLSFR